MNFKNAGTLLGIIVGLLLTALLFGLSWIITCGIIYLIMACFGWTFSWPIATGIWLVTLLLRSIFKSNTTVKK